MFTAYTAVDSILFFVSILFLAKATSILIKSLNEISRSTKVEIFALAGFFSAVATSLPELVVSVSSSLSGRSNIALGLVLGSNISDLTLVIGTVAIVGGGLSVVADFVKKDVLKTFGAVIFPIVLLMDGTLNRIDGLLLLITFFVYHLTVFKDKHRFSHDIHNTPMRNFGRWLHSFNKSYQRKQFGWLLFGLIMLVFAADMLVQTGIRISSDMGLPVFLVGLVFLAMGATLPELVFETRAIKEKQVSMVFGDLLGSLVANSTLILGLAAFINPIVVTSNFSLVVAILSFLIAFFCLWVFIRTKFRLDRWEGGVLLGIYFLFFIIEVSQALLH